MPATTVLPDRDDFTRRLTAVDDEPHRVDELYPKVVARAGTRMTGPGFVMALQLAFAEYTKEMPPVIAYALGKELGTYVRAVIDDPAARREALDTLGELASPT
ncbi:hypothetical protein [Streptomyces sp. H27-C3]|uniref:hypothetical protein n=1 Tax=Streptomyces sp. H27-C3 TaxID=3046305 RepID=UPI0024BB1555|nr:hypothetical protein [Streptomyces sp. H27-C3]MDJ0467093.1 hypothetical protein [Streptomyces sp. H27-C3]